MSTRGRKSRAQRQPLVNSQVWDTRQLLMQESGYRPILSCQAKRQTFVSHDEYINFAEESSHPTGLTQLGYHYTPTSCNGDDFIDMPSELMGLT